VLASESFCLNTNCDCVILKKPESKLQIRSWSASGSKTEHPGSLPRFGSNDRNLEAILAQSDEFSQSIIEHLPLGISVRNSKGQLLTVNQAWRDIWQIPPETIDEYISTGKISLQFDERDSYLGEWLPRVEKIFREGGLLSVPEICLTKHRSGETRWVSQTYYAIPGEAEAVDRVVTLTQDITDRKQAEDALTASQAQYEDLFNTVQEGIGIVDENEFVRFANPAFAEILGESSVERIIGRSLLRYIPPDQRHILQVQIDRRRAAETSRYEIDIETEETNRKTVFVSVSPRFDPNGRYIGAVGAVLDISDRKRAEEKLRRKNIALREVLDQIQSDKERIRQQIADNLEEAVLPTLSRLTECANPLQGADPGY